MNREGGVSTIPCKVNGLNLTFIFDTGASDVSISMAEATFMLKNGYLKEIDIVGSNIYYDAVGNVSEGITINIREIEIAGLKLNNVKASVVKNNKAPLLLGQSAISKLGKIQLDSDQNTLTIFSGKGNYDFSRDNPQLQASYNSHPKKSINPIIGNSIKIGNLVVAEHDFPITMDWKSAKAACTELGTGWRLPTNKELKTLSKNSIIVQEIENINVKIYWSSTDEIDNGNLYNAYAWGVYLLDGFQVDLYKGNKWYVRAVRSD
jgi:clan AA aspartic protease (TIGR02281 family)